MSCELHEAVRICGTQLRCLMCTNYPTPRAIDVLLPAEMRRDAIDAPPPGMDVHGSGTLDLDEWLPGVLSNR